MRRFLMGLALFLPAVRRRTDADRGAERRGRSIRMTTDDGRVMELNLFNGAVGIDWSERGSGAPSHRVRVRGRCRRAVGGQVRRGDGRCGNDHRAVGQRLVGGLGDSAGGSCEVNRDALYVDAGMGDVTVTVPRS